MPVVVVDFKGSVWLEAADHVFGQALFRRGGAQMPIAQHVPLIAVMPCWRQIIKELAQKGGIVKTGETDQAVAGQSGVAENRKLSFADASLDAVDILVAHDERLNSLRQ